MFRFVKSHCRKSTEKIIYRKFHYNIFHKTKILKRNKSTDNEKILENSFAKYLIGMTFLGGASTLIVYESSESFRKYVNANPIFQSVEVQVQKIMNMVYKQPQLEQLKTKEILPIENRDSKKENIKKIDEFNPKYFENHFKQEISDLVQKSESINKDIKEYETLIQAHADKLKIAIDEMGKSENLKEESETWKDLHKAVYARNYAKGKVEKEIKELRKKLTELETEVTKNRSKEAIKKDKELLNLLRELESETKKTKTKLNDTERQFNTFGKATKIQDQYRESVREGRNKLIKELESVGMEFDRGAVGKNDAMLIVYAHKRLMQLLAQISELETIKATEIEKAVDQRISAAVSRAKEEASKKTKAEIDSKVTHELAKQANLHTEQISQLMRIQREELEREQDLRIRSALLRERDRFTAEISKWTERVQGLEAAVEGRATQERLVQEARELWVSGRILRDLLYQRDTPMTPPLKKHLLSLEKAAAPGDSRCTIKDLCRNIPEDVAEKGVVTQINLIERWPTVYKVTNRVSMVPETGSSIFGYMLSWFRSALLITPAKLLDSESEVDPESCMDTNLILASADRAVTLRDFDLAVRLLGLLHGMSRLVADDWMKDAVRFLETAQTLEAIESYTASRTVTSDDRAIVEMEQIENVVVVDDNEIREKPSEFIVEAQNINSKNGGDKIDDNKNIDQNKNIDGLIFSQKESKENDCVEKCGGRCRSNDTTKCGSGRCKDQENRESNTSSIFRPGRCNE